MHENHVNLRVTPESSFGSQEEQLRSAGALGISRVFCVRRYMKMVITSIDSMHVNLSFSSIRVVLADLDQKLDLEFSVDRAQLCFLITFAIFIRI